MYAMHAAIMPPQPPLPPLRRPPSVPFSPASPLSPFPLPLLSYQQDPPPSQPGAADEPPLPCMFDDETMSDRALDPALDRLFDQPFDKLIDPTLDQTPSQIDGVGVSGLSDLPRFDGSPVSDLPVVPPVAPLVVLPFLPLDQTLCQTLIHSTKYGNLRKVMEANITKAENFTVCSQVSNKTLDGAREKKRLFRDIVNKLPFIVCQVGQKQYYELTQGPRTDQCPKFEKWREKRVNSIYERLTKPGAILNPARGVGGGEASETGTPSELSLLAAERDRLTATVASYSIVVYDGSRTFTGDTRVTGFTVATEVTNIGDHHFSGCPSLASLGEMRKGVRVIGRKAFHHCPLLTSLQGLPEVLTTIHQDAFSITGLTSLDGLPSAVSTIGSHAFSSCPALTSIGPGFSPDCDVHLDAFYDCDALRAAARAKGFKDSGDATYDSIIAWGKHHFATLSANQTARRAGPTLDERIASLPDELVREVEGFAGACE